MDEKQQSHPLILVFYLQREMMMTPEIIKPFAESVNSLIELKKANIIAFFLPTDGIEEIKCINPILTAPSDIENINIMIEDIKKQFDVGQGADLDLNNDDNENDN